MFFIETDSRAEWFHNEQEDDFLRYIPEHIGADPDSIRVYYFDRIQTARIKSHLRDQAMTENAGNGLVRLTRVTPAHLGQSDPDNPASEPVLIPEQIEVVEEMQGKRLSRWPYDEGGRFLGNQLEVS